MQPPRSTLRRLPHSPADAEACAIGSSATHQLREQTSNLLQRRLLALVLARERRAGWAAPPYEAYAREVRGRSPICWLLLTLFVGGIGLALDKGFTDNTPPYDEPPIASIGVLLFLLCGCAFVALCTVALSDRVNTFVFLLSVASAIALLVLAVRASRHRFGSRAVRQASR